jgi:hypothetical protein
MFPPTNSASTQLSPVDSDILVRTAKWARFLGIAGMIISGVMVVLAFFIGSIMATFMAAQSQMVDTEMPEAAMAMMGPMYAVIFIISAAIYFVPALLLYQYGNRVQTALRSGLDPALFTQGLHAGRRFFKFVGILAIILMVIYGFAFIMMILFAAAAGSMG